MYVNSIGWVLKFNIRTLQPHPELYSALKSLTPPITLVNALRFYLGLPLVVFGYDSTNNTKVLRNGLLEAVMKVHTDVLPKVISRNHCDVFAKPDDYLSIRFSYDPLNQTRITIHRESCITALYGAVIREGNISDFAPIDWEKAKAYFGISIDSPTTFFEEIDSRFTNTLLGVVTNGHSSSN